jgi:HSP20 family protein
MRYTQPRINGNNKRFSDIMDEFFNDAVSANNDSFVPSIDVSETEDQFVIEAELPGMAKGNININLENGRLAISGERRLESEEEGKTFHRVETKYGSFNRSFQLPDNIDEESINASYKNGLLHISIQKSASKVKKQIEIK